MSRRRHAERFVVPARACHPLPDEVPWDVGVLITGDGFGVPYHASTGIAAPSPATVAVFGVGPIGLGSVILQAHLGRQVIAIDVTPRRPIAASRPARRARTCCWCTDELRAPTAIRR